MKLSIAGFTFHGLREANMMDVFGYLETVRYRYHLNTADIWNGLIGNDPEVYLEEGFLKKLKSALLERELTLVNYHVDGVHVWDANPEVRERNYRNALRHLQAAEYLGAQTVRIDAGGQGEQMSEEQFDFTAARYSEYARRAGEWGCRVGPENHWGPSLNPNVMVDLARAVDHPAYGVLLHLGHWEVGDELEGDRRLAPWAMHTHVDARITQGRLEDHLRALIESGYSGCWGVEHHSARNEYAEAAWQLAVVRRALTHLQSERGEGATINPLLGF